MLKVGISGGIGSGKSMASSHFKKLGAYVFDADKEAKKLVEKNEKIQQQLIEEFGSDIQNPDKMISNKKLARVAFSSEDNQAVLNAIIHPFVFDAIDERFKKISGMGKYSMFVVDAALIYESGLDQHLDYVIIVTAKYKHRLQHALERGNLSSEDVIRRMELQLPEESKVGMADSVINNNGTLQDLKRQVDEIFKELI